ncbi:MAG TPA: DUF2779 domain-containing protein [Bacteroidales bacterium]|nr:DUF2779 domain-containing protein [Bacteroidales bacterium]HPS18010.1 DUF2779 domain-containing protein [Bacteroidales bacterium]
MKNLNLSKSSFIRGLQCKKSLYLYKNFYNLRDKLSPETLSKFSRGHNVGILAQQLFPDGVNMQPYSPKQYARSVTRTMEMISGGSKTIYEAAFSYKDVIVFLDILNFENGKWHAYEVKSSASVSETYKMDASLQYYVITNSGTALNSFNIIYINENYKRQEQLDINKLFCFYDVLNEVKNNLTFISEEIDKFKTLLSNKDIPDVEIGTHCSRPYLCDFYNFCRKDIPKNNSIFSIPSLSEREQYSLYKKGITSIENIPGKMELSGIQKMQIDCHIKKTEFVNIEELKKYFSKIKYPLLIADIQWCKTAIPGRKNINPYQHVPFSIQSVLIDNNGNETGACNYFQEDFHLNTEKLYQNIFDEFNKASTILCFSKPQMICILQTLCNDGYLKSSQISDFEKRMIDMETFFNENIYYNPLLSSENELQNIARHIFKTRISREMPSSDIIASDLYDSLQVETDMFNLLEIKEKLNEYANFKLETIKKFFFYLKGKTTS